MSDGKTGRWLFRLVIRYFVWSFFKHHTHLTNSTFLRRATAQRNRIDQRPAAWHWLAGWQRAVVKLGLLGSVTIAPYEWMFDRPAFISTAGALAGVGGIVAAVAGIDKGRHWRHERAVIRPLRLAVARFVGQPDGARGWIDAPRRYAIDPERPVVISLPQGFDRNALGDQLVLAALDRLPAIKEPITSWHNSGPHPTVKIHARPAPPERVTLAELLPAIHAAPGSELILGIGCDERLVTVSLLLDSPHIALSAPSNSGKSVAAALMIAQQLYRGAFSIILDIKAESHAWAFGLPNVAVMTRDESIHSALILIWQEVQRRQRIVETCTRARQPRPTFVKMWVVVEEMNVTRPALKELWDNYREEDKERAKMLPKASPALAALAKVSFAGRSVQVHAILVAQRLTTASTGDPTGAVRENMGVRYMITPRPSTWNMLADGANFPRFLRGTKGRAHVVVGGVSREVQGGFSPRDDDYRDLATSGTVTEIDTGWRAVELRKRWVPVLTDPDEGETCIIIDQAPPLEIPTAKPVVEWVTVTQAVSQGMLTGSPASVSRALRRARGSDGAPEGRIGASGLEYDPAELAVWQAARTPRDATG